MTVCSKTITAGCLLLFVMSIQSGCATTENRDSSSPQAVAAVVPHPQQPLDNRIITGKVAETMDSGGYTYVNLDKDGQLMWIAMPSSRVAVGQEISILPGVQMGSFTSVTLNRTFDNIIFSSGLASDKAPGTAGMLAGIGQQPSLPPQHPSIAATAQPAAGHPSVEHGTVAGNATISGKVVETMNSGGYTYINLEKDGNRKWVAVPSMKVAVGQELELKNGAVMTGFFSKTLNRTFDAVIFSAGPVANK